MPRRSCLWFFSWLVLATLVPGQGQPPINQKAPPADPHGGPRPDGTTLPAGTIQFRLSKPALGLALSPDGKLLACTSQDGAVHLFDPATGQERRTLRRSIAFDGAVSFLAEGKTLATVSSRGTLDIWDIATGELVRTLGGKLEQPSCYAVSARGKLVAMGNARQGIFLCDPASGEQLRQIRGLLEYSLSALALSADGKILASVGNSKAIRLWDTVTGQQLHLLKGHQYFIAAMAFSPDGKTPASHSMNGSIRLWDTTRGAQKHFCADYQANVEPTILVKECQSLAFSPDGKWLAVADMDRRVRLTDVATGKIRKRLPMDVRASSALFGEDGRTLFTSGATMLRWDLSKVAEAGPRGEGPSNRAGRASAVPRLIVVSPDKSSSPPDPLVPSLRPRVRLGTSRYQPGDIVHSLAFSADGKSLVSGGRDVRVWDTATGRERYRFGHDPRAILGFSLAPNGKLITSFGSDSVIHVRDLATGKEVAYFPKEGWRGVRCLFTPDSKQVLSAGDDFLLHLWDVASGKELRQFAENPGTIPSFALSPDGRFAATACLDKIIRVWEVASGKELRRLSGHSGYGDIAFTSDGNGLAAEVNLDAHLFRQAIQVWDIATGKQIRQFRSDRGGRDPGLAFSPDGKWLAAFFHGRTIAMWEVATGKQVHTFEGHQDQVRALAFSPDSKVLASGALDRTIRLWDVVTGKELAALSGHRGAVSVVAFRPDGRSLTTSGLDRTIRVWDADTGAERAVLAPQTNQGAALCVTGDARIAVAADLDGVLRLRDLETGKDLGQLGERTVHRQFTAVCSDGKLVAGGSWSAPLNVWDLNTHRLVWATEKLPYDLVTALAFSADGDLLAIGTQATARAGAGSDSVIVRDAATGALRQRLRGQDRVFALAFSQDNKALVSGSSDVRLWELLTARERWRLPVESRALAISPNGRLLATGGTDNAVHLWQMSSGREIGRLLGHDGGIQSLCFSADGKRIGSGSADNCALIWDVSQFLAPGAPDAKLSAKELAEFWTELADSDAPRAFRAIEALTNAPSQAIAVCRANLRPTTADDLRPIRSLIIDLDSDSFGTRERATTELSHLGIVAQPLLREALSRKPSAETESRIARLLSDPEPVTSPAVLRSSRAIEILERLGTDDARGLLESLARGTSGAWLALEAKAAQERLALRLRSASRR